jgi:hypothetical protein
MKQKQSGSGLIFAVVLLFVILGMVVTLSSVTVLETKMNQKTKSSVGAFFNADSGVEWALNKISRDSGATIADVFGIQWQEANDYASCPMGGCNVYFLDEKGKVIVLGTDTIDKVKAVRAVGTQGNETQRAIEAAVPPKVVVGLRTNQAGCNGILTTNDTCPSLLYAQPFGGGGVYYDFFLDCDRGEIPSILSPQDCPTESISSDLINPDDLRVGPVACGQYVTTSDTCISLYAWETVSMSGVYSEWFLNCDGTVDYTGKLPHKCPTSSLDEAGFSLDDLRACPENSGGYLTVSDACPPLYYTNEYHEPGVTYRDYFKTCEGNGSQFAPGSEFASFTLCPSNELE